MTDAPNMTDALDNNPMPARPMRSQFDNQDAYDQALVDYSMKQAAKQIVEEMKADMRAQSIRATEKEVSRPQKPIQDMTMDEYAAHRNRKATSRSFNI
jgi:hypothetical protein